MSKPFQRNSSSVKKPSAQHNTASTLVRGAEVDSTKIRRVAVNYGKGDEPSEIERKRKAKEAKQASVLSARSKDSRLPEVLSPNKRASLMSVKEEELKRPPLLKQRVLPDEQEKDLLFPRMHGIHMDDDDDATVMTGVSTAAGTVKDADQDQDETSVALTEQLLGMPGGLELDQETTGKYFGIEARLRFMQRVQWMANQRNIYCTEPDDYADDLVFEDDMGKASRGDSVPFGASRPLVHSPIRHPGSVRNPMQGGSNGSTVSSLQQHDNHHINGMEANDDMMLRQAAMRVGHDYRDDEDADFASPVRVEAREKDMMEELDRIMQREMQQDQAERDTAQAGLEEELEYQAMVIEHSNIMAAHEEKLGDGHSVSELSQGAAERLRVRALLALSRERRRPRRPAHERPLAQQQRAGAQVVRRDEPAPAAALLGRGVGILV